MVQGGQEGRAVMGEVVSGCNNRREVQDQAITMRK